MNILRRFIEPIFVLCCFNMKYEYLLFLRDSWATVCCLNVCFLFFIYLFHEGLINLKNPNWAADRENVKRVQHFSLNYFFKFFNYFETKKGNKNGCTNV